MHIKSLHFYPIKSCGGVSVESLELGLYGPKGDREFMVVDSNGAMMTQRTHPELAQVQVVPESNNLFVSIDYRRTGGILINREKETGQPVDVTVHDKPCVGFETDPVASAFFSDLLGQPCKLVKHVGSRHQRSRVSNTLQMRILLDGFADGYPLLVTSTASLKAVNEAVSGDPVEMERFRPNIVLDECEPWDEDRMRTFWTRTITFDYAKICERCSIPQLDAATQKYGKEPAKALVKLGRRGLSAGSDAVCFGSNYINAQAGTIRVNDEVTAEYREAA